MLVKNYKMGSASIIADQEFMLGMTYINILYKSPTPKRSMFGILRSYSSTNGVTVVFAKHIHIELVKEENNVRLKLDLTKLTIEQLAEYESLKEEWLGNLESFKEGPHHSALIFINNIVSNINEYITKDMVFDNYNHTKIQTANTAMLKVEKELENNKNKLAALMSSKMIISKPEDSFEEGESSTWEFDVSTNLYVSDKLAIKAPPYNLGAVLKTNIRKLPGNLDMMLDLLKRNVEPENHYDPGVSKISSLLGIIILICIYYMESDNKFEELYSIARLWLFNSETGVPDNGYRCSYTFDNILPPQHPYYNRLKSKPDVDRNPVEQLFIDEYLRWIESNNEKYSIINGVLERRSIGVISYVGILTSMKYQDYEDWGRITNTEHLILLKDTLDKLISLHSGNVRKLDRENEQLVFGLYYPLSGSRVTKKELYQRFNMEQMIEVIEARSN